MDTEEKIYDNPEEQEYETFSFKALGNFFKTNKTLILSITIPLLTGMFGYHLTSYFNREKIEIIKPSLSLRQKPMEFSNVSTAKDHKDVLAAAYITGNESVSVENKVLSSNQLKKALNLLIQNYDYAKGFTDTLGYGDYQKELLTMLSESYDQFFHQLNERKSSSFYFLEIIVFNEGNSQAVIRNRAELTIENTTVSLSNYKPTDFQEATRYNGSRDKSGSLLSDNYLIIKPKEYVVMKLQVDPLVHSESSIATINNSLKAEKKSKIDLYDIYGENIDTDICQIPLDNALDKDDEELKELFATIQKILQKNGNN